MKLICIGDSLTFGYGVRPSQRWTRLCAQETGWEIVNEGISGDTTGGMLVRLRALLAERDICVQRPLVLLMGGANDIFFSGTDTGARANMGAMLNQLLSLGVIPIVDENDSISTYEIESLEKFGDNDTLSAVVSALIGADLLILLSDIDGLFTDDPNKNPDAKFIDTVETLDERLLNMAKSSSSNVGTGGMITKLTAARIATAAGCDMVIANGKDFHIIHKIVEGKECGTLFQGHKEEEFRLIDYIDQLL